MHLPRFGCCCGHVLGYLQAAVYTGLNGVLGKEGWQWLFIFDGFISLPICLAGYWMIPDLPENTRAWYLSAADADLARRRMESVGRAPRRRLGWGILGRVFSRWHVYALTMLYIVFINTGPSSSVNPFALWLKDRGFPVSEIVSPFPPFSVTTRVPDRSRTSSPQAQVLSSSWPQYSSPCSATIYSTVPS